MNYSDVIVKDGEDLDATFFNRRFLQIVAAIQAAEDMASVYGTTSQQLLELGLTQINGVLGPLLAQLSDAATLGFLTAPSLTSLSLIVGAVADFTIVEANRPLFEPTPFLTVQDPNDNTRWASLHLIGYNKTTGLLNTSVLYISTGSSLTGANWVLAASGASLPAIIGLAAAVAANKAATDTNKTATDADAVATAADRSATHADKLAADGDASAAHTDRVAADASAAAAAASAASIAGGPVASIATLTGIVSTAALKAVLSKRYAHGDSDYTIPSDARVVETSAALTAPRTWTLPAASALNAGEQFRFVDAAGALSAANTLTLLHAGSDTINGSTSKTFASTFSEIFLESDGTSKWTYDVQGVVRGGTGATTAVAALQNLGTGVPSLATKTALTSADWIVIYDSAGNVLGKAAPASVGGRRIAANMWAAACS